MFVFNNELYIRYHSVSILLFPLLFRSLLLLLSFMISMTYLSHVYIIYTNIYVIYIIYIIIYIYRGSGFWYHIPQSHLLIAIHHRLDAGRRRLQDVEVVLPIRAHTTQGLLAVKKPDAPGDIPIEHRHMFSFFLCIDIDVSYSIIQ